MASRLRGRRGMAQRARRLRSEPLCRDCRDKGLVQAATVIDHIVPLISGGDDSDANCRALCHECHRTRTAEQFGYRKLQQIGADGWPVEG